MASKKEVVLKMMSSVEEGREKFSSFTPLSDRLSKEVNILSIGELFGGTNIFNHRAMIGVYGLLREQAKDRPFDAIFINGGALAELPRYATRRNLDKMALLMPGIEDVDDCCAVMRRAMKVLTDAAGDTPIVYIFGEEDRRNIEWIYDRKVAETKKAGNISGRIETLKEEMAEMDSRMADMKEEGDSLSRELKDLSKKVKAERRKKESDSDTIKELEGQIRDHSKQTKALSKKRQELNERKRKTGERAALLEDELENLGAVMRTKIQSLTPSEAKELRDSATKEYLDLLQRLFEGANVTICQENISLCDVGGVRMAFGHNVENTSVVAKRNALSAREEAQSKMQLAGLIPKVDLFLYGHHPATKCWVLPQSLANDHPLYLFQQGGFADPNALFDAYNSRLKTPQTEALEKQHVDSGVTIITARKDGSMFFDMLGLRQLEQHARPILVREHDSLHKKLEARAKKGEEKEKTEDKEKTDIDARRLAQLRLELPSKLSDAELGAVAESSPRKLRETFQKVPLARKIQEVKIDLHTDTHLGLASVYDRYNTTEIMNAAIKDSESLGIPDIIIFGGDMVEGALGSGAKLHELTSRNFIDEKEFERRLRDRIATDPKLGEMDFQRAMLEYYNRRSHSFSVPNMDVQVTMLAPLLEYAAKVVSNGGDAIIIGGNHYNQSSRSEILDEAVRLGSMVRAIAGLPANHPRVHEFVGGWIGSGATVTSQGIPIFGIHKAYSSRDHATGLMQHKSLQRREGTFLHVAGHVHDGAFGKTLDAAQLIGVGYPGAIPFVDQVALHFGLSGYARMHGYVDQDKQHFESLGVMFRLLPQLQKYLKPIDPLFLEIFRDMVKKTDNT